ncbi:hypothetical protein CsatB_030511 [Cannabis sativa]
MLSFVEFIKRKRKMRKAMIFESYFFMLCLTILLNSSLASSKTTCLPDQSSTLLKLKQEFEPLTEPDLIDDTSFYSYPKMKFWKGKDCCKWDGVKCNMKTGQVVSLDLSNSWLQGPLSSNSSLFDLDQLQRLNLAYNNFNSSIIPSRFSQLSRLTHLNLSYSHFVGKVPNEITWLNNLVSLDLSTNFDYVDGINPLFLQIDTFHHNFSKLQELYLDQVNLTSLLPQSLSNLTSLTSLSLIECDLYGDFPSNIFLLPNIQLIHLRNNYMLNGFLPTFHSNSNLKSLNLYSTKFSGPIPQSIGNLKSLITLNFAFCNFVGTIPSSIGNLSHLVNLDFQFTNLTGQLPSTFGNLSKLEDLSLSYNSFSGKLPSTMGNLVKLKSIYLDHAGFTGELPSTLGNLRQLEFLDVVGNGINGRIPLSVVNLTRLTTLYLHYNGLNGDLPLGLTNLTKLESLGISYNALSGAIPSSLFTMPSLSEVLLNENQFTGPLTIHNNVTSSQLTSLSLSSNKLNGPIPNSLFKLKSLVSLSLDSNNFNGTIKLNMFSKLRNLQSLYLSQNSLSVTYMYSNSTLLPKLFSLGLASCNMSGKFPYFLKNQNELMFLDISNNRIEGEIPNWFINMSVENLNHLNFSHNHITHWETPQFILPWTNLKILDSSFNKLQTSLVVPPVSIQYFFMSENRMSGGISDMFCDFVDLVVLDVSNNHLNGTIPSCLTSFSTELSMLSLKGNNFHGKIPQTFLDGNKLMTLDLSHNQFQGKVPKSLIKCKALEVLNLGHNQLSDRFPFWLQNLPELQVLVLRSNNFSGPIWQRKMIVGFAKLRIVDLSFNNFNGRLPFDYFKNWRAINNEIPRSNNSKPLYMERKEDYYQNSVTLMNKGSEMKLMKILTIFTSIDLSNNHFHGEIPTSIGDLPSLIVLNLSSNNFEGQIMSSLGNLKQLESLDLSKNKLFGTIPRELASLTFLSYLNLSQNQLTGPIPQGGQMATFQNSSFQGNVGLCGFPLSMKCEQSNDEKPSSSDQEHESSENGFTWRSVMVGYGSGFVVGAIGGYFIISKKPNWVTRIYGRKF